MMPRQFALKIQDKYSKGWRKEAQHLGQLWDIERAGSIIKSNFSAILTHWGKSADIEMADISFIYRAQCDRAPLKIGDMLLGKDVASKREQNATSERYTVVSMRLLRPNIVIRTDERCTVFRPTQRTLAGDVPTSYNWNIPPNSDQLAFDPVLAQWAFYPQPVASSLVNFVWANILLGHHGTYDIPSTTPLTVPSTGWIISLGLLKGVTFREGDTFVDADGDFYRVDRPYTQVEAASVAQIYATRLRT